MWKTHQRLTKIKAKSRKKKNKLHIYSERGRGGYCRELECMKILSLIEIEIPYDYKKNQTFLHRIWTAKSVLLLLLTREREREISFLDWKMLRLRERERERRWIYYGEFKKKMTVTLTERQRTWFSLVLIGLGFSNDAVLYDQTCCFFLR
jgi:hypothetical protein